MNLKIIQPKNKSEDILLSITKNCETLNDQTHRKAEGTLEIKMTKPRKTFCFKPPIKNKKDWMLGLTSLEFNNSIFTITEQNNKFELYNFPVEKAGGVPYIKVRDEIEKDLGISHITAADLQDEIRGPVVVKEYKEQLTKRMEDVGYTNILSGYPSSVFQDFESYLSTEIDLVEDDIRLVLDKYNSSFITYEVEPRIYTFKDLSEALFNILHSEYPGPINVIDIEVDDITMKTKLFVRPGKKAIRFDENLFFSIILDFTSCSDYKHYIEYTSQKIVNSGSTNKIHLKCDVIDDSVVNGSRRPILFSFVLEKKPGYKLLCGLKKFFIRK